MTMTTVTENHPYLPSPDPADRGTTSAETTSDAPTTEAARCSALEHELERLRGELRAAERAVRARDHVIADLDRTVRLNDAFAGIVGHDLRGPLSTIVMAGQLLLGSVHDPTR